MKMFRLKQRILFSTGSISGNNLLPNTASSSKTPEDLACKVVDKYRDKEKESLIEFFIMYQNLSLVIAQPEELRTKNLC